MQAIDLYQYFTNSQYDGMKITSGSSMEYHGLNFDECEAEKKVYRLVYMDESTEE